MASRLHLHEELCEILGSRNVYYNSPESVKMEYEAIRYSKSNPNIKRADDKAYAVTNRYDGVVITYDPDSETPIKLLQHFQMCSLGSSYTVNNLNHFPFTIYY
jgi:hypothetical protein